MSRPMIYKPTTQAFRKSTIPALLISATMLAGCATNRPLEISYDANVPPLPAIPVSVTDERLKPLLDYVERTRLAHPSGYVTVVLPEFVPRRLWQHLLHNQHALHFYAREGYVDIGATWFELEGEQHENRLLVQPLPRGAAT